MNRQFLIDLVVTDLAAYCQQNQQPIEVKRMAENDEEYRFPINKGSILVGHADEDVSSPKDVLSATHDLTLFVHFELRSKTLYGGKGIFQLMDVVDQALLGKSFPGYKPLVYSTGLKFVDITESYFVYETIFKTQTKLVQSFPNPEPILYNGIPNINTQ